MTIKEAVKRAIGPKGRSLVRRLRTRRWAIAAEYQHMLHGLRCLEIGGPTEIFASYGSLPLYSCLGTIDNCNFSEQTIWSSNATQYSRTFVLEGTTLDIESDSYDCVIASHCLEHIANPIKALLEWKRVLRPGGIFFLILPHRDLTFDWRRPVTPLEHMKKDYEVDMPESDLTHFDETIALHDLSRDPGGCTPEEFRERSLQNFKFRAMHHHVFLPETAIAVVREVGFSVIRQDVEGFHIMTLAKKA